MKRRTRVGLTGLGIGIAFVGWRALALAEYRAHGIDLVAGAASLPRRFEVGQGKSLRIVTLGDSTMAGVGASGLGSSLAYRVASSLGARVSVTNLAVSGSRLEDVVREQLPRLSGGFDLALVSISANDATHRTSADEFERDLVRLLDGLRGARRVVLTTTPDFRTTPALPWVFNRLFERRASVLATTIRRVAGRYPSVRLADLNRDGTLTRDQYAADGFHPNDAGYAKWAAILGRAAISARP